ncbi:MAG: hypothetical protein IID44_10260 [Planctomycetes bacterium]|nr:hypothetical protein [Planctomycetota bacterium]
MPKIGTQIFDARDRSRVGVFSGWTDHPMFGPRAKVRVVGRATFYILLRYVRRGRPDGNRRRRRKQISQEHLDRLTAQRRAREETP